uniref:Uncharacterized protein n=1 Tax=Pristionchus pacificus TaxID=54126 RepID=A0A2A6B6V0_PRIPA|eukprot:PDM61605.1 hypothetical protein PRIPAC_51047 [Pristionchus pacificus]
MGLDELRIVLNAITRRAVLLRMIFKSRQIPLEPTGGMPSSLSTFTCHRKNRFVAVPGLTQTQCSPWSSTPGTFIEHNPAQIEVTVSFSWYRSMSMNISAKMSSIIHGAPCKKLALDISTNELIIGTHRFEISPGIRNIPEGRQDA